MYAAARNVYEEVVAGTHFPFPLTRPPVKSAKHTLSIGFYYKQPANPNYSFLHGGC